ncbi:putative alcohol dehydrogenase [Ceraceosorus guamensis]|uniref:Putative alcohol dehydrogenase n=1 Tax=Ceraceosorus guamensis TaxID=1522189 RepID=A0A316VNG6_9BASI|nr:putative alcohol dehydrogenase [Ceraceosorus guamensis]PWN39072.1 putative alcohol dehydrogenase [Ceraceosorus guamensis]
MVVTGRYPSRVVKHENLIPTSDGAGEVAAVGEGVKRWALGDRVSPNFSTAHIRGDVPSDEEILSGLGGAQDGMLAQYRTLPESSLVRIPDYLSYEEASTLPCAALTAYNALFGLAGTPLKAGETAVLEGTGGVSVFGAQIALAAGAVAVITSSSDEKLAIVKKSIPQEHQSRLHLHNYSKDPDWAKAVKSVSGGIGAARVLDVGGSGTITKAFESVRPGGVVSAIGIIAKGSAEGDLGTLIRNSRGIYAGIIVGSRELFEEMNRLFEAHQIKPLIDRVFPFDQAVQAYQHLESQKHVGKIVIRVA